MLNFNRKNTGKIASWWRNVDRQILLAFFFLFLLGLFFSFSSTSSMVGERLNQETYFLFAKHLIFVLISIFLMCLISIQNRKTIESFLLVVFLVSIFLLTLVPFIGVELNGSKRWIDFPYLPRFQPIELVKPFFVIVLAKIIVSNNGSKTYFKYLQSLLILFFIVFLLVNQPDLGQALLVIFSWNMTIFVSGRNMIVLS